MSKNSPKHENIRLIAAALITVFCLVAFWWHSNREDESLTLDKVKTLVRQNIHLGDSPSKVMTWLNSKQWDNSYIDGGKDKLGLSLTIQSSSHSIKKLSGVVQVKTPEIRKSYFNRVNIYIIFYFDKRNKLIDYDAFEMGTSL